MSITIAEAGTMYRQYLPQLTGLPCLRAAASPTTLAEAPIGVALPPVSVPIARDHARVPISAP